MAAANVMQILTRLENGKISPDRAVRLIRRLTSPAGPRRRIFSCLTIRVRPVDRRGIWLKIPLGLLGPALRLATLNRTTKKKLQEINISRHELSELIRTLKNKDCCFSIMVESANGEKVQVHN